MLEDIETLRNEVQALRGEIEVQSNALSQLKERQRELYLGLDRRLLRVEGAGASVADAAPPAGIEAPLPLGAEAAPTSQAEAGVAELPPVVLPSTGVAAGDSSPVSTGITVVAAADPTSETPSESPGEAAADAPTEETDPVEVAIAADPVREQQDYQAAFNLLKNGRYDDAAKAFRTFLATYAGGDFVDNARYWLGETYYVTRHFDAALGEFQGVIALFPQSPKLTHAMLKVGYIHHELGRTEEAKQALLELVENHPDSTAAGLARKRLKRLQSD